MSSYFTALVYPLRPNEAHLFRWTDHASVMLNPDGPPARNTPSSVNGHELFEIEQDTLWDVAAKRLQEYDEPDNDDAIEAHLEPIAQATAERFVVAYNAHDALVAYAKAEEANHTLEELAAGYYDDLDGREVSRLWWETLDQAFPSVAALCPPVSLEEMIDLLGIENEPEDIEELRQMTPAELRDRRWRYEGNYSSWGDEDGDQAEERLWAHLKKLRQEALAFLKEAQS